MAKNYSSSDSENDLFITQNTFINYNLDISKKDQFLLHPAQGLQTIGSINKKKPCRFVYHNALKTVHSVV